MVKVTVYTEKEARACPIRDVLDRVGDKWSLLVLLTLETDTKRFMEIKRLIGDISQRVLTQTLRNLERDGYIFRKVYPQVPPKVEYQQTEMGRKFLLKLLPIIEWANEWHEQIIVARQIFEVALYETQHKST